MPLKEILDKIQDKLPADVGDDITTLLADARREANIVLADLSAANNESKERRLKLSELSAEIDNLKAQLADATKEDPDMESIKKKAAEFDNLIEKQKKEKLEQWKAKHEELLSIVNNDTDKRKDKISALLADFLSPAEGEEYTPEMADANLKLYSVLQKAGAFEESQESKTQFQRKSNPADTTKSPDYTFGQELKTK